MAILKPDKTTTLGGVTVNEYCLQTTIQITLICPPFLWRAELLV